MSCTMLPVRGQACRSGGEIPVDVAFVERTYTLMGRQRSEGARPCYHARQSLVRPVEQGDQEEQFEISMLARRSGPVGFGAPSSSPNTADPTISALSR